MDTFKIRKAKAKDSKIILDLISKLAKFEHLPSPNKSARNRFIKYGFGQNKKFFSLLGYANNFPISYAIYFFTFSTFECKPTLYLEDLFVLPKYRGKGFGQKFIQHLAMVAIKNDCARMEWSVLDWNKKAQKLYLRLGAKILTQWNLCRVSAQGLKKIAEV